MFHFKKRNVAIASLFDFFILFCKSNHILLIINNSLLAWADVRRLKCVEVSSADIGVDEVKPERVWK